MEFWGVEVKAGKPLKVNPDDDTLIHISQASLGVSKDKMGGESVPLFVRVGDQKLVMGTLSQESFPQISCDLVFEKEFELSHNWKNGSVYFIGYRSPNIEGQDEEGFYSDSEESDEEQVPASATINGKPRAAVGNAKAIAAKVEAKPASEDDDSDEDDDFEDDDSDSEEGGMDVDDSDDSEDEKEEEFPIVVPVKKRMAMESASRTPVPSKKAKAAVTPQKTEEKKGGHTATPHPAKKGGKTPGSASQGPKSAGQFSCGSCKKSFNSDNALQSHNKAKHTAK